MRGAKAMDKSEIISTLAHAAEVVTQNLKNLHGGCLYSSAILTDLLRESTDLVVTLNAGSLEIDGTTVFNHQKISKILDDGKSLPEGWSGHAWVACEDVIVDPSIFQTIYSRNKPLKVKQYLDEILGGYKPYLLGQVNALGKRNIRYVAKESLSKHHVSILVSSAYGLGFAKIS